MELPDSFTSEMDVLLDCVRYALAGLAGRKGEALRPGSGQAGDSRDEPFDSAQGRQGGAGGGRGEGIRFRETNVVVAAAIRAGLKTIDPDTLVDLANAHRVMPLLYRALRDLVQDTACKTQGEALEHGPARLKRLFLLNAARNIRMTEELCRILRLFEEKGIKAIPIKGPVLAVQAYGSLAMRQFDDLDLLLRREDMIPASKVLRGEEYEPYLELDPGQARAYVRSGQDWPFVNRQVGTGLDLNSSIISHALPQFATVDELVTRCECQTVEEHEVTGLAADDVFLTLCVHGTHHGWERLSWLADVAALAVSESTPDLSSIRQKAREAGLESAVVLALQLLSDKLGLSLADPAPPSSGPSCPFLTRLPSFSLWRFQFAVLDGWRHKLRFVTRRLFVPSQVEWRSFPLPGWLCRAHYFIRPIRLVCAFFRPAPETATD